MATCSIFINYKQILTHPLNKNKYIPQQAAIDLDQASIETQIALQTETAFNTAKEIYQQGGHSKSYALLTLSTPLAVTLNKGTIVTGTDTLGAAISGKAYSTFATGSTVISVQYSTSDVQADYVGCQIGALPVDEMVTKGCFNASGTISLTGDSN